MNSNMLEKLIVEHWEEAKQTKERLQQKEKQFEENSRRNRQEIERIRNEFFKD